MGCDSTVFTPAHVFFALLVHHRLEDVEDLLEAGRCVDVVEASVSEWRAFVTHHRHFLDEGRVVLCEVLRPNPSHVEDADLPGHHQIVIVPQLNVVYHRGDFYHVLDRVHIWVIGAVPNENDSR